LKKSKRAAKGEDVKQETEVIIIDGKKQFRSIDTLLNKCDVIIEVLDARDPNSCRNK
jgi:ribosome biogenesis GTPase A